MQGLYIYNAVNVVAANALAKKGARQQKYIEKPIDVLPKTERELKQEAEKEREKVIAQLTAWEQAWKNTRGR